MFSAASARIVRCSDCHLLFVNPQPSDRELEAAREAGGPNTFRCDETDAQTYLNLMERYYGANTGRLLQIGDCPREFITEATGRGFLVADQAEADGEYDLCAIFNEIERSRNPRQFLEGTHRLLRPGGAIFIVTPALHPSRHSFDSSKVRPDTLFYFRSPVLQSLLIDSGFASIIVPRADHVPSGQVIHMARQEARRDRKVVSVIVPVFNEERTFSAAFLRLLAKEVEDVDLEIVVVESNSTDGTRAEVLKYADHPRVKIVLEDAPRGKGHAVRAAFQHITGDFVIIQDADLEYDLEDYEALLEPLRRNRAAFVLGARHGGSAWKMRQFNDQPVVAAILNFAHWFFTALINVGFGGRLKDPFTMYKVFRRDCLYGIRFECNRFDFDWEIVINFLRKGYQPLEIPVNYRSRSFAEGKKVSFFRDPLTWFRVFLKLRFTRFDPLREIERQRREKPRQEADDPRQAELAQ